MNNEILPSEITEIPAEILAELTAPIDSEIYPVEEYWDSVMVNLAELESVSKI